MGYSVKMEIYEPAEDSFLLAQQVKYFVKKNNPKKILDMGAGSGIQTEACIDGGLKERNLTLVDINPLAVKLLETKFSKAKIIESDLFKEVKGKFNLIIFNPPYLPESKHDKERDTTGGKTGSEVINSFLHQAKPHIEKNGKILLLTSSLTKNIDWNNFKKNLLSEKKIFYEELYVWELSV